MKDRVVLITNVEHFVGRPVAAELAGQGATVVCHDRSFADAAAADEFASANPGLTVVRAQTPAEIVAAATEACGRVDVVVCNDAGAAVRAPIEAASPDDLRAALEEMVVFPFEMAARSRAPDEGAQERQDPVHHLGDAPAGAAELFDVRGRARRHQRAHRLARPGARARQHPGQRHRAQLRREPDLLPARAGQRSRRRWPR